MKQDRVIFLDYLRGIACFLVMMVHASEAFYAEHYEVITKDRALQVLKNI